jgi:hypothetical protein
VKAIIYSVKLEKERQHRNRTVNGVNGKQCSITQRFFPKHTHLYFPIISLFGDHLDKNSNKHKPTKIITEV